MLTLSPYLAGGNAGRQSPPGGWSWHSPSRRWKEREGQACRMSAQLAMGKPNPWAPPPSSPGPPIPNIHVPVFPDSISPSSGSSTPIFQGIPPTHTFLYKVQGSFQDTGQTSPVTAVTWIIQVGGLSPRAPPHALLITLLPRALVLSQEDGVRIPALTL